MLTQIQRTANDEQFALLAYCFMPDHLHLLVEGSHPSSDLRRFARIAKQRTGYASSTRLGIAPLWQDGYYERVLRCEETTEIVARYIFDNPVKGRLVARAADYPCSGGSYWAMLMDERCEEGRSKAKLKLCPTGCPSVALAALKRCPHIMRGAKL